MKREKFVIEATAAEFYVIHRFIHFVRDHFDAAEKMVSFLEYKDALGDFSPSAGPAKIFEFKKEGKSN